MALHDALKELLGPDLSKMIADRVSAVAEPAIEAAVKAVLEERLRELLESGSSISLKKNGQPVGWESLDGLIVRQLEKQAEQAAAQAVTKAMAWRRDMKLEIRLTEAAGEARDA